MKNSQKASQAGNELVDESEITEEAEPREPRQGLLLINVAINFGSCQICNILFD
jgi:hypothetical protein